MPLTILVKEVLHHWIALVTGSVFSLYFLFPEKRRKKQVAVGIFLAALMLSMFFAWQDEYTSAQWRGNEISRLNAVNYDQQTRLENQQAMINSSAMAQPLKPTMAMSPDSPTPKGGERVILAVLTTNKMVSPVNLTIHCEHEVKFEMRPAHSMPQDGWTGGATQEDAHTGLLTLSSPAWSPDAPLLVRIYQTTNDDPICQLK